MVKMIGKEGYLTGNYCIYSKAIGISQYEFSSISCSKNNVVKLVSPPVFTTS